MQKQSENVLKNEISLKKLGSRLRQLRKLKGYKTAEDAAGAFEMQRAQYTRYEAGSNLTYLTLIELLEKMNISLKEFFSEGFD